MYEIKNPTPNVKKLIEKHNGKLEELINRDLLPPTDRVCVINICNFRGDEIPADVFKHIDYGINAESAGDLIILGELMKRVKNGKVDIAAPVRKDVGIYRLQYNFVRSLKPNTLSKQVLALDQPFNTDPKSFNYARNDTGIFDQIKNDGLTVDLRFNYYPFAPYHFLWLPDRKKEHNQFLDPKKDKHILEAAWNFVKEHGENIWLCYNSLGAHATVNHLHIQGFLTTDDWEPPYAKILREFQGGPEIWSYIPGAKYFPPSNAVDGLCDFISEMNDRWKAQEDNAYNFCMNSKGVVCFPRKKQNEKKYLEQLEKATFTTGPAILESLGEFVCPVKEISVFELPIIEKKISELYQAMALGGR